MKNLYPLKFTPILKEMIWGGIRIPIKLNYPCSSDTKVGELYAISGLKTDESVVCNGILKGEKLSELISKHKSDLLGRKVYNRFGKEFPLLIKFIDANDDLSIQVHPNDDQAKAINNGNGKTEMWYVVDREQGASLIAGFSRKISKADFEAKYKNGELMELMHLQQTQKGDSFFIPAGKVHSIGKGNLIAEIQQTSDITYRIYDFDRKDKEGNKRDLHYDKAVKVINFEDADSGKVRKTLKVKGVSNLVDCTCFTTNLIDVDQRLCRDYNSIDSFVILINTEQTCELNCNGKKYILNELESILIPACINSVEINSVVKCKILEVYVK